MSGTQFAAIWIAVTLISGAAFVMFVWAIRGRRDSVVLLSFCAWSAIYGLRLLAFQPLVRATLGGSPHFWAWVLNFLTYIINVPGMLFFVGVLGFGWRRTLLWIVVVQ